MARTYLIPVFVMLLFFTSCIETKPKYTMYVPNTIHTPLIKQKGDYNFTTCFGFIGGFQAQAAYSPINHLLLYTNVMKNFLVPKSDTTIMHTHNFETGLGLYYSVGKYNLTEYQLNMIAGFGQGYSYDNYTFYHDTRGGNPAYWTRYHQSLNTHYYKYFIQPSCDVIKPHSTTSYSIKISVNNVTVNTSMPFVLASQLNGLSEINLSTFEFAVTHQHRYQYMSTYFQYRIHYPLDVHAYEILVTSSGSQFAQSVFSFTFGITLNSYNILKIFKLTPNYKANYQ